MFKKLLLLVNFILSWKLLENKGVISLSYKQILFEFTDKDFKVVCSGNLVFKGEYLLINCEDDFNPQEYNDENLSAQSYRNTPKGTSCCQGNVPERIYQSNA